MKPDFQRRIQRYGWDKSADFYEHCWQTQLQPAQDRLLEVIDLKPGERVLDVACGTGLVTFPAAEAVAPGGTILGTDLSDAMIEAARQIGRARKVHNATFEQMDAEALDLSDHTFDAALNALGLMYVPEPLEALREMHRVLAPGGRAAAVVWGARTACGWAEAFPIVDRRVASDVCPLFFQQGTGETLRRTFEAAGFTSVKHERFSSLLHFASDEDACAAIFLGGPVALAWDRFDEDTRAGAREEYLASIEPYQKGDGYAIPGEFVVTSGLK